MLNSIKRYALGTALESEEQELKELLTDRSVPPETWRLEGEDKTSTPSTGPAEDGLRIAQDMMSQILSWAGNDPKRWGLLHNALLRIYAPRWESIDARDTIVGWTGAWLSLTRARQQLQRLQSLKRPLTWNERNEKGGREADISFWGRLTKRLSGQIPAALSEDIQATRLLTKLCAKKVKNEQ